MAYQRTNWVAGGPPGISAARLNNMEDGIVNISNFLLDMKIEKIDNPEPPTSEVTIDFSSLEKVPFLDFENPTDDDFILEINLPDSVFEEGRMKRFFLLLGQDDNPIIINTNDSLITNANIRFFSEQTNWLTSVSEPNSVTFSEFNCIKLGGVDFVFIGTVWRSSKSIG